MGPKWVGPRGAQVGGPKLGPSRAQVGGPKLPKPGPSGWAQAGPKPEIWDPTKIPKIKILKIKIRSAQNVGKVWISRKKNLPAPFGALPGNFLRGPEKSKKCQNIKIVSLFSLVDKWLDIVAVIFSCTGLLRVGRGLEMILRI